MTPKMLGLVATAMALTVASSARADEHGCDRLSPDFATIDGMLDEWRGVSAVRVGAPGDAGIKWRCGYDDEQLYLAFDVRDERVVRTRRVRARREDSVVIELSAAPGKRGLAITAFPGSVNTGPARRLGRRKLPRWIAIEDSLQGRRGFTMEMSIPLARIPGYRQNVAEISARVAFNDADQATARALDETLAWRGALELLGKDNPLAGFLHAVGKSRADIDRSRLVDVGGAPGKERVVIAGPFVGIIGSGFQYLQLPVASESDVLSIKFLDLEGRGARDIVANFEQHGNGGAREMIEIWRVGPDNALAKLLAVELGKEIGEKRITSKWRIASRRRGGHVLIVEVGEAENWDATNYYEARAADADPILLPWGEVGRILYLFENGRVEKRTFPRH